MTATPASLEAKLDELTDLFRRRLLEDKAKQRAFDELYEQLQFARSGLADQFMTPLVKEVLMVCDRIETMADGSTVLWSVLDELLEVFRRRGLEEIDCDGLFDPKVHESIGVEAVRDPDNDNRVVSVRRAGYRLGDRIVRPARVVVARLENPLLTAGVADAGAWVEALEGWEDPISPGSEPTNFGTDD